MVLVDDDVFDFDIISVTSFDDDDDCKFEE